MAIKTRIVRIGNSRGIRVPKVLLDQAQLPDEVELHAEPARTMGHVRYDRLLDPPSPTRFGLWSVGAVGWRRRSSPPSFSDFKRCSQNEPAELPVAANRDSLCCRRRT